MRLGELMIGAGWAQPAQVAAALLHQRTDRRRLGALLVAYAGVSADDVARGLARQRGVPAALERHLAQRDPALTTVVPAEIAIELAAVPVAWSRGAQGMALVVCFRDPTPDHVAELVRVCGVPIIPAIACEAVIARELAAAYPGAVPREDDDSSVDVNFDDPSSPVFALVDLDDRRVLRDESQAQLQPPRAGGVLPPSSPPVPRVVAPPPVPAPPPVAPALTLAETLTALVETAERDAVADLAIDHARGTWRGAVVLVVREGLAVGHRGFGGQVSEAALAALAIPLTQPSMFSTAVDERRALVGAPPPGGLVQTRFLKLFEDLGPAPIALYPVAVRGRVVNLIFAIAPIAPLPAAATALGQVAAAMGEAYERLILTTRGR
jgi:hypothetical protein